MLTHPSHAGLRAGGRWLLAAIFAVSLALAPRVAHADPVIAGLNVTQGSLGSNLIIYGSGFGDFQGSSYVTFDGQMVPALAWSDGAIYVVLNGASAVSLAMGSAYPIVVVLPSSGQQSNAMQFTLMAPPPPDNGTGSSSGTTPTANPGATTGTPAGNTTPAPADVLTPNDALEVEQIAAQFFTQNDGKEYLTAAAATNPPATPPAASVASLAATNTNLPALKGMVDEITADHNAHVAALQQLLGASVPPPPTFQNLDAPTLAQFLTMAQTIEDFAAGAQQGVVLAALQSPATGSNPTPLLTTEVAVLADDARLDGGIRGFRKVADTADGGDPNTTLTQTGTPLTRDQVVAFLQPYLTAANPAPANGGTTPSTSNPAPSTDNTGTGATTPGTGSTGTDTTGGTPTAP